MHDVPFLFVKVDHLHLQHALGDLDLSIVFQRAFAALFTIMILFVVVVCQRHPRTIRGLTITLSIRNEPPFEFGCDIILDLRRTEPYSTLFPRYRIKVDDDVVVLISSEAETSIDKMILALCGNKYMLDGVHVGEFDPHERFQYAAQLYFRTQYLQLAIQTLHLERCQSMYLFPMLLSLCQVIIKIFLLRHIKRLFFVTGLHMKQGVSSNEVNVS